MLGQFFILNCVFVSVTQFYRISLIEHFWTGFIATPWQSKLHHWGQPLYVVWLNYYTFTFFCLLYFRSVDSPAYKLKIYFLPEKVKWKWECLCIVLVVCLLVHVLLFIFWMNIRQFDEPLQPVVDTIECSLFHVYMLNFLVDCIAKLCTYMVIVE